MPSDRAPLSPSGWQVHRYTYDGRPPTLLQSGRSLEYCKLYKSNWGANADGTAELVISPVDGWESLNADPFGAIAWAIASDLVSVEVGASLIRAIAEREAGQLSPGGLVGLAAYYARFAVAALGGDAALEAVVGELNENVKRLIPAPARGEEVEF